LESIDRLFALPRYKISMKGNEDAHVQDQSADDTKVHSHSMAEHVEVTNAASV
jgi:hypothetical protein